MSYTDLSSTFIVDLLFDFVTADELAENDKHIKDSFDAEHNFDTAIIDGSHKEGIIGPSHLQQVVAGDYALNFDTTENNTTGTNTVYKKLKELKIGITGTARLLFELKTGRGGILVAGQIFKNGTAIGIERTSTLAGYVEQASEDFGGLVSGDLLQLYGKDVVSGGTCFVRKFLICVDNPMNVGQEKSFLLL